MSGSTDDPGLEAPSGGMTPRQAATAEVAIIALCVIAMVLIFQPFWLPLFSVGAGLVVLGGLAFNLIPLCRPGVPAGKLVKVGLIVLVLLVVVAGLSIGAAWLYGLYIESRQ
jgi:hypothetical protein